ncbi:uncharacterized protein [Henckelia pumila]
MAIRSKHSLEFTPHYGYIGEPTCFTIKLYYNGTMETSFQKKSYKEKENLGTREDISIELLSRMQQDEGDDDCANSGDMGSATDSEDDDSNRFLAYDPNVDSKNPDLKLGMIFSSKKEAKFAIESHCIRRGMMIKFVKNDKSRL